MCKEDLSNQYSDMIQENKLDKLSKSYMLLQQIMQCLASLYFLC